jgi:hypothetical protein
MTLHVVESTDGVVLPLRTSSSISGRIQYEGDITGLSPAILTVAVMADPADGNITKGQPSATLSTFAGGSRRFELTGLTAGAYFLRQRLNRTWTLKSVTFAGREYLDAPLELAEAARIDDVLITLTRSGATIAGRATFADGTPAFGADVVVFPTDRTWWTNRGTASPRFSQTATAMSGAYRVSGLPAGEYFVAIVPEASRENWQSPESLSRTAPAALRVRVDWGADRSLDVRAGSR